MRAAVKQFIEETIDLIEEDKWSDVAYKAESWNIDGRLQGADLIEFWKIVREDLKIDLFKFEDVEVEVVQGNQPVYSFIIGVE